MNKETEINGRIDKADIDHSPDEESRKHTGRKLEELSTGADFNDYQGDWSYWDIPIIERMKKTEELLISLFVSILSLESMLGGIPTNKTKRVIADSTGSVKAQIINVLWPVVYDMAVVNLRLSNSLFYFDLNSCEDPIRLVLGMTKDTNNSISKVIERLRVDLSNEDTDWFHRELDYIHPGLAFIDRKLTYDIGELGKALELIMTTDGVSDN